MFLPRLNIIIAPSIVGCYGDTFATWMLRNGAKIENVSRMLGHTNIRQTQRYAKVMAESVHEDFNRISEKMKKDRGR